MECDELIEQMLKEPDQHAEVVTDKSLDKHRERLAALVAGGKCSQYLGENYTIKNIDNMTDEEIQKLYARYESRLGATMTKTIGSAMLQLYTVVASTFLPIPAEHRPYLCKSLENPFIEHAISSVSCEFYHRYGMFLAPVTTALITSRYCQFKHTCPLNNNGDSSDTTTDCTTSDTTDCGDTTTSERGCTTDCE